MLVEFSHQVWITPYLRFQRFDHMADRRVTQFKQLGIRGTVMFLCISFVKKNETYIFMTVFTSNKPSGSVVIRKLSEIYKIDE